MEEGAGASATSGIISLENDVELQQKITELLSEVLFFCISKYLCTFIASCRTQTTSLEVYQNIQLKNQHWKQMFQNTYNKLHMQLAHMLSWKQQKRSSILDLVLARKVYIIGRPVIDNNDSPIQLDMTGFTLNQIKKVLNWRRKLIASWRFQ